jgi:cytochrome o ubiquinol oxidase subunit 3
MFWTQAWLLVTAALGLVFLGIERYEFASMIGEGAGPQRSAFLSSFFTLVGCHGLHVTCGILWIGTMMAQIWAKGFQAHVGRRLLCLSVFWHALDIIWVAIFTIVYLIGTLP